MSDHSAEHYYNIGFDFQVNHHNYQNASENYQKCLEINPQFQNAYFGLATCQKFFQQYDQALENYDKILKINPTYVDAIFNKGDILIALNRIDEGIEWITKAINLQPDQPLFLCNRGKQYIKIEQYKLAINDLNCAFKLSQDLTGSNKLSEGNILYIKQTLNKERERLVYTINELDESENKTEQILDQMDQKTEKVIVAQQKLKVLKKKRHIQIAKIYQMIDDKSQNQQQNQEEMKKYLEQLKQDILDINKDLKTNTEQINSHLSEVQQQQHQIIDQQNEINQILVDSGAKDKAKIKQDFHQIMIRSNDLHIYCKTLYWTLLNYIQVYRSMSTGMLTASDQALTTNNQNGIQNVANASQKILQNITQAGTEIAKMIPFVGGAIAAIDSLIQICWTQYKNLVLQEKIDAIQQIIRKKVIQEDDISLIIGKLSVKVTIAREGLILDEILQNDQNLTKNEKIQKYIIKKVNLCKHQIINSPELNDSYAAQLALRDSALILTYIYQNFEEISEMDEDLDVLFSQIIVNGSIDKMVHIDDEELEENKVQKKIEQKTACCMLQ